MRKILLIICLLPLFCNAQDLYQAKNIPIDKYANKINFTEVVRVDSISKDLIYRRAKDWVTRYFMVAHATLSMDDPANGKLIARGTAFGQNLKGLFNIPFPLVFNIIVTVKEGRYKYEVTDFNEVNDLNDDRVPILMASDDYVNDPKYKTSKGEYNSSAKKHLEFIAGTSLYIIGSLKEAIKSNEHDNRADDNW